MCIVLCCHSNEQQVTCLNSFEWNGCAHNTKTPVTPHTHTQAVLNIVDIYFSHAIDGNISVELGWLLINSDELLYLYVGWLVRQNCEYKPTVLFSRETILISKHNKKDNGWISNSIREKRARAKWEETQKATTTKKHYHFSVEFCAPPVRNVHKCNEIYSWILFHTHSHTHTKASSSWPYV